MQCKEDRALGGVPSKLPAERAGVEPRPRDRVGLSPSSPSRDMPAAPTVGIVVPSNTARYLRDALASLLSQTAESEIVVVDDGSPDGEVSRMAREFGLAFIRNPTSEGPPTARNIGIEALRHPWIINFDGDNIAAPRFVERLLGAALRRKRTGIAYCLAVQFGEASGPYWPVMRGLPLHLARNNFIDASSMFARSAWEEVGGWDPEAFPLSDWDLWLGIVERGWRIGFVPEYLLRYRVRSSGILRSTPKEHFRRARRYIWNKHADFLTERHAARLRYLAPRIVNRIRRRLDGRIVSDEVTGVV
jgi:GT2 family glycosyltransferase